MPLAVAIPLGGAVLASLAGRMGRRIPFLIVMLCLAGSAVALLPAAGVALAGNGAVLSHFLGHVGPVHGQALGIAVVADPLGLILAFLDTGLGLVLALASYAELGRLGKRELGGYCALFLLLVAALIGAAVSADLINLFVWFQVAALASYGLTGFFLERPIALEATFKVVVLTSMAGFAVFLGGTILYRVTGALNLGQLHDALARGLHPAVLLALGLLVIGFITKAGLVPVHGWLPDAHTAAPGAVSALFSGLMVNLGVVTVVRVVLLTFPSSSDGHGVLPVLLVMGVVSAVAGAALALGQDDLKRVLAWDTVSQMGIVIVGFATSSAVGEVGATYHLISHAIFKSLLFLCAGSIVHTTGLTRLSQMGGLFRHRTLAALGFCIGGWAIAGLPPLTGYASLGLIHEAARSTSPVVFGGLLLAQVLTVAALGRAAYLAFFRRRESQYESLEKPRPGMIVAVAVLGSAALAFGAVPGLVLRKLVNPAASALAFPDRWAAAVLSGAGTLPKLPITFEYFSAGELALAVGPVVVGVALGWWATRWSAEPDGQPGPIRALRRLHTGSVNDYAVFGLFGVAAVCLTLLL